MSSKKVVKIKQKSEMWINTVGKKRKGNTVWHFKKNKMVKKKCPCDTNMNLSECFKILDFRFENFWKILMIEIADFKAL